MIPLISAYVSAFNLLRNGFDYEESLSRMVAFFDETVIAANTSEDGTLAALQVLAAESGGKMRVISTDYSYTDVTFDGAIKNAALQACTQGEPNRVYCQMDLDEKIPQSQYALWRVAAEQLLSNPYIQCLLVPSVDLWGSMDTIRADRNIGVKYRLHKGGFHRGVWKHAWTIPGKHFDTSRSDSTELLTSTGDLVRAAAIIPYNPITPAIVSLLREYPHVLHTGYADYNQRIRVNKAVWIEHWPLRSGRAENVATRIEDLADVPLIKHDLPLV